MPDYNAFQRLLTCGKCELPGGYGAVPDVVERQVVHRRYGVEDKLLAVAQ